MKYTKEIQIHLPVAKVTEIFGDTAHNKEWQRGLQEQTILEGAAGKTGAVSKLRYFYGDKEMEMIETIKENLLPDRLTTVYEVDGVYNLCEHSFESDGESTIWRMYNDFRFKGFNKIVSLFLRSSFEKQTLRDMYDFKTYVESL